MPASVRLAASREAEADGTQPRVERLDWPRIEHDLGDRGWALTGPLLSTPECRELASSYDDDRLFRSRVVMARHGFGRGEYKYFADPLPAPVAGLRRSLYPPLVPLANRWQEQLRLPVRFPDSLDQLTRLCHAAGQRRPTPLLLRYGPDDFNCLHQDVYGELVFPLQVAILLSPPGEAFEGGEFVLVEQRPRAQSRVEVVPLQQGEGVIFAVRHRPVQGTRGTYRVAMRHGVSRIRSGQRFTLGVIFHDAS